MHAPQFGVILGSKGLQHVENVVDRVHVVADVEPALLELAKGGADDVDAVEIEPNCGGNEGGEGELEEAALEQVADAVKEEGEDGGDDVFGLCAAHGEHLDCGDDAGGDGGDGHVSESNVTKKQWGRGGG